MRMVEARDWQDGVSWSEAVDECRTGGGVLSDLASVHTEEDMGKFSSIMMLLIFFMVLFKVVFVIVCQYMY